MKYLLAVMFACAIGMPALAQSKYDICAAYARDAMMGFYASSAVPVTMADRARGPGTGSAFARAVTGKHRPANQITGSLKIYFHPAMHGAIGCNARADRLPAACPFSRRLQRGFQLC